MLVWIVVTVFCIEADYVVYTEDGAEKDFPFLFGTSGFLP